MSYKYENTKQKTGQREATPPLCPTLEVRIMEEQKPLSQRFPCS